MISQFVAPMSHYAKLRNRALATFIDYVIFYPIAIAYVFAFGEPRDGGVYVLEWASMFPIVCFWFVYFPIVECVAGQTLGKKITGIRVVTLSGKDVSFVNAVLRRLFDNVDMLFFGVVAAVVIKSSDKKQRVGDLVARTIVIKDVVEACSHCREKFSLSPFEITAGTFTCPQCQCENSIEKNERSGDPSILDNFN